MAKTVFHPSGERGYADHGWLKANHSFSFAGWYDPKKIRFGTLRVLNDDIVAGGEGFGKHPHDNMEIITIILEGALEHKDSMGHTQQIIPGEVQVMSAGTGIYHSEYNADARKDVKVLQSWIFPDTKNMQPRYDQRKFDAVARHNKLQTLVAPMKSDADALKIHQDAWIYRAELETGLTISHQLCSLHHGAYIFVISGSISVEGVTLNKRDAIGVSETDILTIVASANSDFLLYEVPMMA